MEHRKGRGKSKALTRNQRLILMEILNGSSYNRQISKAAQLDYSVVSREVGNLEDLGLLARERQDPRGRVKVQLTKKGKIIADTLEDVNRLEESIIRALTPPIDVTMTSVESIHLHRLLTYVQRSGPNELLDSIVSLHAFLNELRERGIPAWYADDLLFNFLLNLPAKDIPARSKFRALAIMNDVILESSLDPDWGRKLRPVVPKLMKLAVDETLDDDVRSRALQTYCRYRDADGSVPNLVLRCLHCHLWHYVTPGYKGFYMEAARMSDNLHSLVPHLSDDQKKAILSSLECLKAPSLELFEQCIDGKRATASRGVDYKRWQEVEAFIDQRRDELSPAEVQGLRETSWNRI